MVDYNLDNLEVKSEEAILNRIAHQTFARVLLWLNAKFDHYPCIYIEELSGFLKKDYSTTYRTLKLFETLGLVKFKRSGSITEILPVLNDDFPIVRNYVKFAKKTLGLK